MEQELKETNRLEQPIPVWIFDDGKPGHSNQLRSLVAGLEGQTAIQPVWLNTKDLEHPFKHYLFASQPIYGNIKPQIAIAAGHAGHLHVMAAMRSHQAFGTLLMSPSLPYSWFDAVICPRHDTPPARSNIFQTFGALNRVRPYEVSTTKLNGTGMIMLGGFSEHYIWDQDDMLDQILQLIEARPMQTWRVVYSRRTPHQLVELLRSSMLHNLEILDKDMATRDWLDLNLRHHQEIWVTPDSASMVFEGIASKRPCGIFQMQASQAKSRVRNEINTLIHSGTLNTDSQLLPQVARIDSNKSIGLQASSHAAAWLLRRYWGYQTTNTRSRLNKHARVVSQQ